MDDSDVGGAVGGLSDGLCGNAFRFLDRGESAIGFAPGFVIRDGVVGACGPSPLPSPCGRMSAYADGGEGDF